MKYSDLVESEFLTDKNKIIEYMTKHFSNFSSNRLTIEPDGLVYDGNLELRSAIDKLKVQFKEVSGYFMYRYRRTIDLQGCPRIVGGHFICSYTKITSLKHCPQIIGNDFHCYGIQVVDPREYRFALYSEIGNAFCSNNTEIDKIINIYRGSANRKYWPHAINLLSKVQL